MGSHVQEEIVMDILSRLPVKSLVRFKCVSESWNTLISEPYFKKKHLNHAKYQPNSQKILFLKWSEKDNTFHFYSSSLSLVQLVNNIHRFDCPSNFNLANGVKLYCSCDGLFLIGIWGNRDTEQPSILLIWNPSTGESKILPHSKLLKELGYYDDYKSCIDDYDDWGCTYGLGYDSTNDDYKVLRIDLSREENKNPNEILALKSCCWKTSGKTDNRLLYGGENVAVVNGAFHWVGILSKFCVVSFNISDEVYGEIPLPEIMYSHRLTYSFDAGVSEFGGMLYVWYTYEDNFCFWGMKDYGIKESWVKFFSITSNGLRDITPIYKFSDDEVLLSMRVDLTIRIVNRLISIGSFGISNRRWPLDCDDSNAITFDGEVLAYTESLISPTARGSLI